MFVDEMPETVFFGKTIGHTSCCGSLEVYNKSNFLTAFHIESFIERCDASIFLFHTPNNMFSPAIDWEYLRKKYKGIMKIHHREVNYGEYLVITEIIDRDNYCEFKENCIGEL
jgi:hypothetical protein